MKRFLVVILSLSALLQGCKTTENDVYKDFAMLKTDYLAFLDYSTQTAGRRIETIDFNTYLLKNSLHDTPILVLYYSLYDCSVCLDNFITEMNSFFTDMANNNKVLFVASDARPSYVPEYGKTLILKKDEKLDLPFKDVTPVLFLYFHGINHCFFPASMFHDSFSVYMDNIIHRYQLD